MTALENIKQLHAHRGSTTSVERARYRDDHDRLIRAIDAVLSLAESADDTVVTTADGAHVPAHLIQAVIAGALQERCPTRKHKGEVPGTVPGTYGNVNDPFAAKKRVSFCMKCANTAQAIGLFIPDARP